MEENVRNIICELCRREGIKKVTEHHLIPREQGGRYGAIAMLCDDCHRQIHALYTNKELYNLAFLYILLYILVSEGSPSIGKISIFTPKQQPL